MAADMKFVLGLKPEAAIEWLKAKGVSAENYRHLTASEIAKVYTISRMTDLDMLGDIKQSMVAAADKGQSFQTWRKEILQHLANKGWLHPNGHNGKEIIDPATGEVFGSPRRLETIYRTNMQSAYMAGQYQTHMGNIDKRPYWMYDAVGDSRTRAAHAAMDGLVYRYDDPFWATFYPPNGYNCRCTVTALAERDLARYGVELSESGEHNFVETNKIYNKKGDSYSTTAYKAPDGRLYTTDRGFDYNVGRINYRPDLDKYDRALAHEFAKAEMGGAEFEASFKQLEQDVGAVKKRLELDGKNLNQDEKTLLQKTLSRKMKFAAGVLSDENQKLTGYGRGTVWLSDDTLAKQISSRGDNKTPFGSDYYEKLPDIFNAPDYIFRSKRGDEFVVEREGKILVAVVKPIDKTNELFLVSYREGKIDELKALKKKREMIKAAADEQN